MRKRYRTKSLTHEEQLEIAEAQKVRADAALAFSTTHCNLHSFAARCARAHPRACENGMQFFGAAQMPRAHVPIVGMSTPTAQSTQSNSTAVQKYQSLAYEDDESEVWRYFEAERWRKDAGRWCGVRRRRSCKRWMLVAMTGVIIATLGVLATYVVNRITDWKFE